MDVKMKLSRGKEALDYLATNEKGYSIQINADGKGVSPMQSLLVAFASCSAVDVELLLAKMRQNLAHLEVNIIGTRVENATPRPYQSIHLEFVMHGQIKEKSAQKAVSMAVEKYCSVGQSLDPSIKVTHSYLIKSGHIPE